MARRSAVFDLNKDQNILVVHDEVKLATFDVMIANNQSKAALLQPLSC